MTPQNLVFLNAWARAEGGSASNNPFNTTQGAPGATSYNSVGVRNYVTPSQGIGATVQTLNNGRYGNILAALRAGNNARAAASALASSPWGTGALVLKILGEAPAVATPPTAPPVAGLPAPQPLRGRISPQALAVLNTGNRLFGLPELPGSLASAPVEAAGKPGAALPSGAPPATPSKFKVFKMGDPIPGRYQTSVGGEHDTAGLPGFPARDYFAKPGSPVVAPISGTVIKLSGHDPKLGAVEGAGGPLGWSVYIQGDDGHVYYLTHMGSRTVRLSQKIRAGQRIGTVADYDKYGRPSHIHMGVSGG